MPTRREVVRDVIATTAPHELELLNSLEELDEDQVTEVLTRRRAAPDPVGFGVTEVSVMATPVVWLVVSELVKRGTGVVADGLFARIRALWRRLRGTRRREPAVLPRLTPQHLGRVYERTIECAAEAGMPEEARGQLADAVVSALARDAGPEPGTHG